MTWLPTSIKLVLLYSQKKLPSPAPGKRSYYYDTKIRGLGIAITSAGSKSFIVYRWVDGKPERVTLGRYPDISIEQARRKASEINAVIAKGENPNERALGSWQACTGASLAIIGKSLNHKSSQATTIYARLDLDPVRASVEKATNAIWVAAGIKQPVENTQDTTLK